MYFLHIHFLTPRETVNKTHGQGMGGKKEEY